MLEEFDLISIGSLEINDKLLVSCLEYLDGHIDLLTSFRDDLELDLVSALSNIILEALDIEEVDDLIEESLGVVSREQVGVLLDSAEVGLNCNYLIFNIVLGILFFTVFCISSVDSSVLSSACCEATSFLDLLSNFLLSLLLSFSINSLLSLKELSIDFLESADGSIDPWVSLNLRHGESMSRVELQHGSNEVFELFTEESFWLVSGVSFPEEISSVCTDKSVEWI